MGPLSTINWVAWVFGAIAAWVGWSLIRAGARTFDDDFTATDRRLSEALVFYWAVPVGIALHELAHAVAIWLLGGSVGEFHYAVYWGYVVPKRTPPFRDVEVLIAMASGLLVLITLGLASIAWALRRPMNAARNFVRLEFGRVTLGLALVFYPIVSMVFREGDFWVAWQALQRIRPHAGSIVLISYGLVGSLWLWVWRHGPLGKRVQALTTPSLDTQQHLLQMLARNPQDAVAWRELGRVQLASENAGKAVESLRKAALLQEHDPLSRYLLGLAFLKAGDPRASAAELRHAGLLLEDHPARDKSVTEMLRYEIVLALAAARLALGDAEGALMTAEAAHDERPRDPRWLFVYADAAVAAGRASDAHARLEEALKDALQSRQETLARQIRKKLETLTPAHP
jgi:tetratricopeptide (TPR) repeat protein